jgi:hypothetical protein
MTEDLCAAIINVILMAGALPFAFFIAGGGVQKIMKFFIRLDDEWRERIWKKEY